MFQQWIDTIQLNHKKIQDETTTAVPLFTKSTIIVTVNATTPGTLTSSVKTVTEKSTTSGTSPTGNLYTNNNYHYSSTNEAQLSTTTAIPPNASSNFVQRQFDTLSFMGEFAYNYVFYSNFDLLVLRYNFIASDSFSRKVVKHNNRF